MPVWKVHYLFSLLSWAQDNHLSPDIPWPCWEHFTGISEEGGHTSTASRDNCSLVSKSLKSNLFNHSWMGAWHNDPWGLLVVGSVGFHVWPTIYHCPCWKANAVPINSTAAFKTRTEVPQFDWKNTLFHRITSIIFILFPKLKALFIFLRTRVILFFFS